MPYPYTWQPSHVYPASVANVKVYDSQYNLATLYDPITVTNGVIQFSVPSIGTYFIEATDTEYRELARVSITSTITSGSVNSQWSRLPGGVTPNLPVPTPTTDVISTALLQNSGSTFRQALDALTDSKYAPVKHSARHGENGSDSEYLSVNLKVDFGAKGDGLTDDTAAVQAFVTYLQTNHRQGYAPAGTYKLTSPINFSTTWGWGIIGAGVEITRFTMISSNVPIFNLGVDNVSYMHSFELRGFTMDYGSTLQTGMTLANPILFSTMAYEGAITDINFGGGYYAIRVANGIGGPWGVTFDNLRFGGNLTGGAMDWSQCVNAVPNNRFGRMFVTGTRMAGNPALAIFDVRGYNFVVDVIECIDIQGSKTLFRMAAGGRVSIESIKLENGTYNTGGNIYLLDMQVGTHATIGNVTVGGNNMVISNNTLVYAVRNDQGTVECDFLDLGTTAAIPAGSALYAFSASGHTSTVRAKSSTGNWTGLQNSGSSTSGNFITVRSQANHRLSDDKGDADYTVALGDPNLISYQTPLTLPRTINLPYNGDQLFNGLFYDVVVNGANPTFTNPLTVKASTTTLATITNDKTTMRFMWRRNISGPAGWTVTTFNNYGPINVKDFGAKGDGNSDDTAAFTSAMAAATSRINSAPFSQVSVMVPPGSYKIGNISVPTGVMIHGDGAVIKPMIGAGPFLITFAGNRSGIEGFYMAGDPLNVGLGSITVTTGAFHTEIKNLRFDNWSGRAIYDNGGLGTTIDNIFAQNCLLGADTITGYQGVVELNGTDAFFTRSECTASRVSARGWSAGKFACAVAVTNANNMLHEIIAETSDHGVYVGAGATQSQFIGVRAELCYGHGWIIDGGSGEMVACHALRNSQAGTTLYNGFHVQAPAQWTGRALYSESGGAQPKQNYGLADTGNSATIYSSWDIKSVGDNIPRFSSNSGQAAFIFPDNPPANMDIGTATPDGSLKNLLAKNTVATNVTAFTHNVNGQPMKIKGDGFTTLVNGTYIATASGANLLLAAGTWYNFIVIAGVLTQV